MHDNFYHIAPVSPYVYMEYFYDFVKLSNWRDLWLNQIKLIITDN